MTLGESQQPNSEETPDSWAAPSAGPAGAEAPAQLSDTQMAGQFNPPVPAQFSDPAQMPVPAFGASYTQPGMPPQYPGYNPYPGLLPEPKRKTGLIVGLVVGVAVLAIVGISVIASSNSQDTSTADSQPTYDFQVPQNVPGLDSSTTSPPSAPASFGPMSLPASGGGLVLLTNSLGQAEVKRVQSGLAKGGAEFDNAFVGSYGPTADGDFRMVLVAQPLANLDPTTQDEIAGETPTSFVSQIIGGMKLPSVSFQTSTDPNAAIGCGPFPAAGANTVACVWTDAESFGVAYFYGIYVTTSITAAGTYTDALRAAAEGS